MLIDQTKTRSYAMTCYIFVLLISIGVLIGWYYHISVMVTILPGFNSMKSNTALCFILLSSAGIAALKLKDGARRLVVIALVTVVIVLCALTLAEYAWGLNFGIDELLFADPDAKLTLWPPGRLAPITGVNFILLSLSFLADQISIRKVRADWARTVFQVFVLIVWVISFQALIGYAEGINFLFGAAIYTQVALHTAVLFTVICAGQLLLHPQDGFMRILLSRGMAGKVGRTLLPAAIFFPPTINWLQMEGQQLGIWNSDFGTLIRILGNVIFFSWIAYHAAFRLLREENERAVTQRRLDLITRSIPTLVSYLDRNETYQFANSAYETMLGIKPEDLVGKKIKYLLKDSYARSKPFIDRALAGEMVGFSNRIEDSSGNIHVVSVAYVPDVSPENEVQGFLIVGHDVTEMVRNEESLQKALDARDELLAVCSHELRTPVTAMKLNNQLVIRSVERAKPETLSPEKYIRSVEQNERQLNRLSRVIEEMLDFSEIREGGLALERTVFPLEDLVNDIADQYRTLLSETGCTLRLDVTPGIQVRWDRFRMEQVLTNLISNASKYAPKTEIVIRTFETDTHVCYSVKDHGSGINPADLERIFSPYERAVSSRNISGLGMGLHIAKNVVEAHQGSLTVESELGHGATFTACIPKTS